MGALVLDNDQIRIEIDPGRGADVLSLVDLDSGVEVLFSTPWRRRADAIRAGERPMLAATSEHAWLEQYRGGWQTLCPNAGPEREYRGAVLGFHGEASVVPWTLSDVTQISAALSVELFTVPVTIRRTVTLVKSSVHVIDELTNTATTAVTVDYSHHPALGSTFLDAACIVSTNGTQFTADAESQDAPTRWLDIEPRMGHLPAPGAEVREFGWLSGFPDNAPAWAAVANPTLGLTVRLSWDGRLLPYAWWWQEFNASKDFPWYTKARVLALEPASTPTSGPDRMSAVTIPPATTVRIPVQMSVEHTPSHTAGMTIPINASPE